MATLTVQIVLMPGSYRAGDVGVQLPDAGQLRLCHVCGDVPVRPAGDQFQPHRSQRTCPRARRLNRPRHADRQFARRFFRHSRRFLLGCRRERPPLCVGI